jgi:hypothetical protein
MPELSTNSAGARAVSFSDHFELHLDDPEEICLEHGSALAGGKHRRASADARRQFEAGVSENAMSQSPVPARLGDPSYTTTV